MGRLQARSNTDRQRGDTIVEVLIAVVVIATVLGGAFVVAQASSRNVQSSQEHSYALQQIQAQAELIRAMAGSGDPALSSKGLNQTFCAFATPSGQIQVNAGNSAACKNIDDRYTINNTVTKVGDPSIPGDLTTYNIAITWDKLGGGTNNESLVYGVKIKP